jgi:hypothetical protein
MSRDSPFWKPRIAAALPEEIQSATDMVESAIVPPRCTGLRIVCSATRSRTRTGLNVRSQSAEAGLRLAGGSLQSRWKS